MIEIMQIPLTRQLNDGDIWLLNMPSTDKKTDPLGCLNEKIEEGFMVLATTLTPDRVNPKLVVLLYRR